MGAELAAQGVVADTVRATQREIHAIQREIDTFWGGLSTAERAQLGADLAGLIDPTPISDTVGFGIAVARGDWWGAAGNIVSMVPYVGDAVGKGLMKGARYAKMLERAYELYKKMEAAKAAAAKAIEAQIKAFKAEIELREAAMKAREAARKARVPCDKPECLSGKQIKFRTPEGGTWKNADGTPATPGNGYWHPDPNTYEGQAILNVTGGKPIQWVGGQPMLDEFATASRTVPITGNNAFDAMSANDAMRLEFHNWQQPLGTTWHHSASGNMVLLDSRFHGAIPHTGTASLARGDAY